MASAREMYDTLSGWHDYDPRKQGYKAELGGADATVYAPNSLSDDGLPQPVTVRAQNIETYVNKGFLLERPVPVVRKGSRER